MNEEFGESPAKKLDNNKSSKSLNQIFSRFSVTGRLHLELNQKEQPKTINEVMDLLGRV